MDASFADDISACASDNRASLSSSILRDIKLMVLSFLATCLIIFAYNYSLEWRCLTKLEKKNQEDNESTYRSTSTAAAPSAQQEPIGSWASGDFLTALFSQLWHHASIAVSNSIKEMIEPILIDLKVPIHFIKLDLGDVPIRTENMFVRRVECLHRQSQFRRQQQGVKIDFDLAWDGRCDILLQATLSKSVKLTFGVQHIKLFGRFSLLLGPFTTDLPVVSAVQYGFTNPPDINLTYAGCVKSLSDKIGFVEGALKSAIVSTLARMLVLPYRMVMPIDLGSYDFLDTYQLIRPCGMLRVGVTSGRGFRILKKMIVNDIPDIYCVISVGASKPFRNTTKYDCLNPLWEGETGDFILYDWDQKISVSVYDEDKGPLDPDDILGKCEITARDLLKTDGKAELELTLNNTNTGCFVTIAAEIFQLSSKLKSFSLPEFGGKNKLCGLVTIIVAKAFNIPLPKEDCATMVKVVYGKNSSHEETFLTGTVADYPGIDARNPWYDAVFHVPLTSKMLERYDDSESEASASATQPPPINSATGAALSPKSSGPSPNSKSVRKSVMGRVQLSLRRKEANRNDIEMTLIDVDGVNGTKGHGALGSIIITHKSLMEAHKHTLSEIRPIGTSGAKLEFQAFLSGVQSQEEPVSEISEITSSEVNNIESADGEQERLKLLLTAVRGRGFEISKRGFGKKDDVPDIYLVIPRLDWTTAVVKDDTMPQWNESKLFTTTTNAKDIIRVDAYDKNSKGKDKYIGTAKFPLDKLLRKRMMEMELQNGSVFTKSYVTLRCVHRTRSNVTTKQDGNEVNDDMLTPLLSSSAPPTSPVFPSIVESAMRHKDRHIKCDITDPMSSSASQKKNHLLSKSLPTPKAIAQTISSLKESRSKRCSKSIGNHRGDS